MLFDMHIHSKYSPDGLLDIDNIVKIALRNGLGGISITDHNTIRAYRNLRCKEIVIIPGVEVSTANGHILVYGILEEIPRDRELAETLEIAKELGGFVVVAHPYRFWSGIGEKKVLEFCDRFDAIEVKNARCKKRSNDRALLLAEKYHKGKSAGSDAHFPEEIGLCRLEVASEDPEEVLKKIRKGEVKIYGEDRNFRRTTQYVSKAVGEWIKRGFRKI